VADDLFTPTIPAPPSTARPWRVASLVYPSFFGGALAATVLGVVNCRRLGFRSGPLLALAAVGVAALVGRVLVDEVSRSIFWRTAFGVAVWGAVALLQRRRFRAFELRGGEPASLVGPGIAAAVGGAVLETALVLLARS
jgi:hypothetical protein